MAIKNSVSLLMWVTQDLKMAAFSEARAMAMQRWGPFTGQICPVHHPSARLSSSFRRW